MDVSRSGTTSVHVERYLVEIFQKANVEWRKCFWTYDYFLIITPFLHSELPRNTTKDRITSQCLQPISDINILWQMDSFSWNENSQLLVGPLYPWDVAPDAMYGCHGTNINGLGDSILKSWVNRWYQRMSLNQKFLLLQMLTLVDTSGRCSEKQTSNHPYFGIIAFIAISFLTIHFFMI